MPSGKSWTHSPEPMATSSPRHVSRRPTLSSVRGSLFEMFTVLQDVDATPTDQAAQAVPVLTQSTQTLVKQWEEIQKTDLPQLKSQLNISALPTAAWGLSIQRGHHQKQGRGLGSEQRGVGI